MAERGDRGRERGRGREEEKRRDRNNDKPQENKGKWRERGGDRERERRSKNPTRDHHKRHLEKLMEHPVRESACAVDRTVTSRVLRCRRDL